MDNKNNIINILNAIDEINAKPKKKKIEIKNIESFTPELNHDLSIPPDVDRLILEAEKYKKSLVVSSEVISTQVEYVESDSENALILTEEVVENNTNEVQKFSDFNNKIKNLEETKKKLLVQIEYLKKDKPLLSKTDSIAKEREGLKSFENNTKENLKFIYKQVEKQKQLFLELELKSIKIERESKVYKENYERLIIENNELKTRLKITKEQIVNYETNKLDLLSALNQLNEILSKSNIVAKISPQKTSSDVEDQKKETKIDSID